MQSIIRYPKHKFIVIYIVQFGLRLSFTYFVKEKIIFSLFLYIRLYKATNNTPETGRNTASYLLRFLLVLSFLLKNSCYNYNSWKGYLGITL